jgi:DNA topoisomerase-2
MATKKYQKHTHHQHILELPDTYVGSTKTTEETRWVYDVATNKMVWRRFHYNPALYKIFDEIIVNARDEYVRSITTAGMTPVKGIHITVGPTEEGDTLITVENDGDGIPIEMNEEEKTKAVEEIVRTYMLAGHIAEDLYASEKANAHDALVKACERALTLTSTHSSIIVRCTKIN